MIRLYTLFIIAAIISVFLYVFVIVPRADYVMQTTVLIDSRNPTVFANIDHIVNNIVYIARESVASSNEVGNVMQYVHVERITNTDMISIAIYADAKDNMRNIQTKVYNTIFNNVQKYYTINKDISVKIIHKDQESKKTISAGVVPYVLMIVIAMGAIAGVLALFQMIDLMRDVKSEKNTIDGKKIFEKYQPNILSEYMQREDKDVKPRAQEKKEEHKEVATAIQSVTQVKKAEKIQEVALKEEKKEIVAPITHKTSVPDGLPTIPGNLPVVDISALGFRKRDADIINSQIDVSPAEPTEEELKARLNELLNGKL